LIDAKTNLLSINKNKKIKVMRKRAKNIQTAIDKINLLLSKEFVTVIKKNGDSGTEYLLTESNDPAAQALKQGLVFAMEAVLHASNSYRGYMPLSEDKDRDFDRKYY
jgi:hypothetical protein